MARHSLRLCFLRADGAYKARVHIVESVKLTSEKKGPFEPEHGMTLPEWFKTPEAALALDRANKAMAGAEGAQHGALIYDYDWGKHGQEATIVDVGGGVGGTLVRAAVCGGPNALKTLSDTEHLIAVRASSKFTDDQFTDARCV